MQRPFKRTLFEILKTYAFSQRSKFDFSCLIEKASFHQKVSDSRVHKIIQIRGGQTYIHITLIGKKTKSDLYEPEKGIANQFLAGYFALLHLKILALKGHLFLNSKTNVKLSITLPLFDEFHYKTKRLLEAKD